MSLEPLKYLSEAKLTELREKVHQNYDRYTKGDFRDLAKDIGWSIELGLQVDLDRLRGLDPSEGADFEIKNAMLVGRTLGALSAALAAEERIWGRLTHLECLEFTRQRWLKGGSKDERIRDINKHYFAGTRTGVRDDNSVSRLWWAAYIAHLAMPCDQER